MTDLFGLERIIAVMLVTKDFTGTAAEDEDVWQEDASEDERQVALETARAILTAVRANS